MLTFRDVRQARLSGPTALTIGNFDGLHLGHRALLAQLQQTAQNQGAKTALLTFDPHPLAVLHPGQPNLVLTTPRERLILAAELGIDYGIIQPFTPETAQTSPRDFVESLKQHLGLTALVVGPDFAIGRNRTGGIDTLRELGNELGFIVEVIHPIDVEGQAVRSSRVRELLQTGAVDEAATLLGRPYRVAGPVQQGDQRGRTVGIPTANIGAPADKLLPADGVYATRTLVATFECAHIFQSVTNVGMRPTVDGLHRRVETHLLDFPSAGQFDDLYGEQVAVDFLLRLRGEQRFATVGDLVAQIHRDIERAREWFGRDNPR
jgi:riboflavin kinase / FMN adenylyltransferase